MKDVPHEEASGVIRRARTTPQRWWTVG